MAAMKKVLCLVLSLLAVSLLLAGSASAEGAGRIERACTVKDMSLRQQDQEDGSFLVAVNNGCFNRNCHPKNVLVSCNGYAPTSKVPAPEDFAVIPGTHGQLCVVNNYQYIIDSIFFGYAQDAMADLFIISANFSC